ncbi:SAM-dependent methyltransferase [Mycolicibacterium iranicum]|uniref:SAM-dependent methyltransferase n=1 Tax=Mycolicibacterium iranicum TaxID=912594 RepID=A0A839Q8W6_MYCIR|nr:class I SAM-dependent methyltransferase [Mycolicibacterium iranicum]MBB2991284.1 SAM-dependent methyltransferase [Mycolicibacterium iranicum]
MNPMPSDAELGEFYSAYTRGDRVEVRAGVGSRRPGLRRAYHRFSGDVDPRDFLKIPDGARVLDYGSGGGTYLAYFDARGVDIVGAEISDVLLEASSRAGLNVRRVDSFDNIPFSDRSFDIVYLMQVFEHVRSPRRFMEELSRVLKPGGELHLAVPNAASFWRRVFGRHWVSGWFAPFHLAHYTAASLAQLGAVYGLQMSSTWSRTPESWFRLNLKAALYSDDNEIEYRRSRLIDSAPMKLILTGLLRVCETFVRERDCLVVSFVKD